MSEKERGVIIVGSGSFSCDLASIAIAELKQQHPNIQVVTLEEAKEKGLSESIVFKARGNVPIQPIILKQNHYGFESLGLSKRAERRKAERDAKKRNRFR
jgi:hypothetical protein